MSTNPSLETILTFSSSGWVLNPSFHTPARLTPTQARADALVSSFVDHATDGYSLAAMVGGGLVYRLGRMGTLAIGSRLVGATHASPLQSRNNS